MVGSSLALVGTFLPWVSVAGETLNGFDTYLMSDFQEVEGIGLVSVFGGMIGLGLGIALLAAGRVLAVAIVAIVFAALGVFAGFGLWAIVADSFEGRAGSIGVGVILQLVGPGLALVGAIIATATRRPSSSSGPYFPT